MSDSGRDEVWTDLESLLRKAEAETQEGRPTEAGPEETGLRECGSSGASEESAALPYQDLLSELMGSWSDDEGGERGAQPSVEGEAEVPLSALMARLTEDPWPGAESVEVEKEPSDMEAARGGDGIEESVASLEALQSKLLEDGEPPAEKLVEQGIDEAEQAEAGGAEPGVVELIEPASFVEGPPEEPEFEVEALLEPAVVESAIGAREAGIEEPVPGMQESTLAVIAPAESAIGVREAGSQEPAGEMREPAMPQPRLAVEWLQPVETEEPEQTEADDMPEADALDADESGGKGEPQWAAALFEELVRADDAAHEPAAAESETLTVEAVAAEETAAPGEPPVFVEDSATLEPEPSGSHIDGWEILASLPAPVPPSFSEPILFEPPLPANSTFDWPVLESHSMTAPPQVDHAGPEEGDGGPETESDDALRRLVGQMLAEMAAASAPQDQSPDAGSAAAKATERFLSFSLAGEVYAVALAGILETDRLPRLTRVPGLPAWAIGVSNLRGSILPVVDLRRLLSLEEAENPQDGRILVVRPAPGDAPSALVVDRLEGVALLATGDLHPAPLWLDSKILPYLEGIGSFKGRLVNVLDLGRLFAATGVSGAEPVKAGEKPLG